MKKYTKINVIGWDIESAVRGLLKYKNEGKLISTEFNGVMLYSDTVTLDDAYKSVTGKTKAEFDESIKKIKEKDEKERIKYEEQIPELIESWTKKGREILTKDKWDLWEEVVPIRLGDLYRGMELKACLDIVKTLNSGTLEEAKVMIEGQDHSGMSFSLVCSMVKEFSPRGDEFAEFMKNISKFHKEGCGHNEGCSAYLNGMCIEEQGNTIKACNLCAEYLGEE